MAVFAPDGKELCPREMAVWANKVHRQAGGKGNPLSSVDFFSKDILDSKNPRLKGIHCRCGTNENGFTKGEFVLFPLDHEAVREGGKAYMKCRKCGGFSHL